MDARTSKYRFTPFNTTPSCACSLAREASHLGRMLSPQVAVDAQLHDVTGVLVGLVVSVLKRHVRLRRVCGGSWAEGCAQASSVPCSAGECALGSRTEWSRGDAGGPSQQKGGREGPLQRSARSPAGGLPT